MAKEKEAQVDLEQTVTLTAGDLLQLFATLQQNQADQAKNQNQALIEGLKELSPHYLPPGQEENAKAQREAQRKIEIFKLKNAARQKKYCRHEVGQTGRHRNGDGAFCGLKLPTGEVIGVCMYCQKVISSANPDHQKFFQQINGTVAEAGQTSGIADPVKAQLARLGEDERKRVLAAREKYFLEAPAKEELEEDLEI